MINHLPECPWPDKPCGPDHEPMHDREPMFCVACLTECICERIKRAERRMREITLQSMDHSRCKWWEGWDSAFFAAEKALDALPVRFVPYENAGGYLTYGALDAANVRAALVALRDQTDADQIAVKYANSSNEEVQMINHLPECQRWYANMPEPDECPACEMFRACEQRVRDEHSEIDAYKGWVKGYAEGLDAARDAVAGLSEQWVCQDTVRDALAAIDELREERK